MNYDITEDENKGFALVVFEEGSNDSEVVESFSTFAEAQEYMDLVVSGSSFNMEYGD